MAGQPARSKEELDALAAQMVRSGQAMDGLETAAEMDALQPVLMPDVVGLFTRVMRLWQ